MECKWAKTTRSKEAEVGNKRMETGQPCTTGLIARNVRHSPTFQLH